MLTTKLIVLQKKICKLLKQKDFLLGLRNDNADFKNWAPLLPRQSVKKLNQVVSRSVLKISTPEGKILTSIFRYLNISIHRKFIQQSKALERTKIWKVLRSQVRKDQRSVKSVWVMVTSPVGSIYPRFTRGFNGRASNPVHGLHHTIDGKAGALKECEKKSFQRKTRREEDYSEITEQDLYTEEFSPVRLYSSLKRKRERAEEEKSTAELPPPHRCRLSCPLPPPNFFPPEKLEYLSSYLSPSVRFATLPLAFLPQSHKVAEGKGPGYTMKAREQKATRRARSTSPPVFRPSIPEFAAHQKIRDRKNYLNLKSGKCQLYPAQFQLQSLPPPGPNSHEVPTMKALLFDPLSFTLKCDVVNAPQRIFKDEVLVQVSYSGVSGSDLFMTEGKVPCLNTPIILGHEICGKVYAAGKAVDHVKPGDSIAVNPYTACSTCRYCSRGLYSACSNEGLNNCLGISKDGGWAEFVVVKKSQVHKIPEELGLDQAVLLLPLSCVLSAMSKLKLSHGMKIFIQGLGLSGCLWASLLHSRGFKDVLVSDKRERNRQKLESLNLKYMFVPPEDVRKFMVDVVIECSGSPTSIEKCFNILNPNGQMCFFGKPNPINEVRCVPYDIIQKEITIFGNAGNGFHFAESIDVAMSLGQRYLQLDKLGVQIFDLDNFREAFQLKKSDEVSKIIFKLDS